MNYVCAAGDRGGGGQRLRERRSDLNATVEPRLRSRSFQLQSLVEREFDARCAQPQPSRGGRQEYHRQGYHQQRAGCRKVGIRQTFLRLFLRNLGTREIVLKNCTIEWWVVW